MTERWLVGLTELAGLTDYTGGIGRHYSSLLPALVRDGVQIDVVLFFDGAATTPPPPGIRVIAWHRLHRVPRLFAPLARALLFRRAYGRGYDRVFLPEWAGIGALLPRNAPLVTNLATSTRVANRVSGFSARSFGRDAAAVAVQSRFEDRQIRRSRGVVPISRAMLAANRRELGRLPPAIVVRNCIDVAAVQEAARRASLPEGWPSGPTVLFLGRLERRKGVVPAFAAFARIAAEDSEVRLVLAGASGDRRFEPTRSQLLGALPPERRGDAVFLGHVAGDALYAAIAAATVVICPSLWEGFGQVALEVKALGTPVVVTSGSGYDDFCTDGVDALLVPPGDDAALAASIARLLADPALRERLSANALAGIGAFTADAVAPDLRAAVRTLSA